MGEGSHLRGAVHQERSDSSQAHRPHSPVLSSLTAVPPRGVSPHGWAQPMVWRPLNTGLGPWGRCFTLSWPAVRDISEATAKGARLPQLTRPYRHSRYPRRVGKPGKGRTAAGETRKTQGQEDHCPLSTHAHMRAHVPGAQAPPLIEPPRPRTPSFLFRTRNPGLSWTWGAPCRLRAEP